MNRRRIWDPDTTVSGGRRVMVGLGVTAFVVSLQWVFLSQIYTYFVALQLPPHTPEYSLLLYLHALALAPVLAMPITGRRPSLAALWFLYLSVYIPSLLVPPYLFPLPELTAWMGPLALAGGLGLVIAASRLKVVPVRFPSLPTEVFEPVLLGMSGLALLSAVVLLGLPSGWPSLEQMYEVREGFVAGVAAHGRWLAYLLVWVGYVVHPALLGVAWARRSWGLAGWALFGQVLLVLLTGLKSMGFVLALAVGAIVLGESRRQRVLVWGLLAGAVAMPLMLWADDWGQTIFLESYFIRRPFIVPGAMTGCYFDFFSGTEKLFLGEGVLRGVFPSPYQAGIAQHLGERCFHTPGLSANANFWADGFANFGVIGVMAASLGLGFVFWVADRATVGKDPRVAWVALLVLMFPLSNSGFLTTLSSHGLALGLLVMLVSPQGHGWKIGGLGWRLGLRLKEGEG